MVDPPSHLFALWPRTSEVFLCGVLCFFIPYLSQLENQNQILLYLPHKIICFYLIVKQLGFSNFYNGKETSKVSARPLTAEGRAQLERGTLSSWPSGPSITGILGEVTSSLNLTLHRSQRESWIRWYLRFLPNLHILCRGKKATLAFILLFLKLSCPKVCG